MQLLRDLTSTSVFQWATVPADGTRNTSTAESPNVACNCNLEQNFR